MTFDENDIHSAALCAWKEARGEGPEGMEAVLCVLRNRVGAPGFGKTLHDVIYGKNQFTSMSVPSDPEFNLQPNENEQSWRIVLGYAEIMNNPNFQDVTNGAHYYANLHTMDKDGWFYRHIVVSPTEHPLTAQIGKHTFFA